MPRFYVEDCRDAQTGITITGEDVNHIKNVLRLSIGDSITICDGAGKEYVCQIAELDKEHVYAEIVDINQNAAELPCKITLFQGMPKSDKMAQIAPVMMKRTVVKLEEKKKDKKRERYQMIAESAAKQSGRGVIPEILDFMTYGEALQYAKSFDLLLVPYESAEGIAYARTVIAQAAELPEGSKIGIFIGPEGGFAKEEIDAAKEAGAKILTLGNRILRTETAGLAILSICSRWNSRDKKIV